MYYKAILNYARETAQDETRATGYRTYHERQMGFTHEEFARCLPLAVAGDLETLQAEPGRYRITDGNTEVVIVTNRLPDRKLGSLVIPVLAVSIDFRGASKADYEGFMSKFDRHFLRVGG